MKFRTTAKSTISRNGIVPGFRQSLPIGTVFETTDNRQNAHWSAGIVFEYLRACSDEEIWAEYKEKPGTFIQFGKVSTEKEWKPVEDLPWGIIYHNAKYEEVVIVNLEPID